MIIVSAPSGAGKTTIVRSLLESGLELEFSVSSCSRTKRFNETEGEDYYFMTVNEFREKINRGEFLEWEEVYEDHFYGTLNSEVDRIWAKGKYVIFDVDVKGGLNIKKQYPDSSLAIFIQPPSVAVLKERLLQRSTENEKSLDTRISKAETEMEEAPKFDLIIINDDLDKAIKQTIQAVRSFLFEA